MKNTLSQTTGRLLLIGAAALLAACVDDAPLAPARDAAPEAQFTVDAIEGDPAIDALRRATDRYHNLKTALAEDFVLLHECEERPGEGPVGTVYVNIARLLDGVIDPNLPDALIYQPVPGGSERLVGVEFAVPYALWPSTTPPQFLGATFQREDEFGVFALHAWVWLKNPEGMFAEANPKVSCN
jgi:hypothetical protein